MSIDVGKVMERSEASIASADKALALNRRQELLAMMATHMAAGALANSSRVPASLALDVVRLAQEILNEVERKTGDE